MGRQMATAYSPKRHQYVRTQTMQTMQTYQTASSPHTYTPSYSHLSSSPSPINASMPHQRRYSENVHHRPIVDMTHQYARHGPPQQHGHQGHQHSQHLVMPPTNQEFAEFAYQSQPLQRSASHQVLPSVPSPLQQRSGRRSVVLPHEHRQHRKSKRGGRGGGAERSQEVAQLHTEWLKKYVHSNEIEVSPCPSPYPPHQHGQGHGQAPISRT